MVVYPKIVQGQQAEQSACEFLQTQGLQLVARNYRCKLGEIDLVMRDADHLVFVEVRMRSRQDYGNALESVDYYKQQKIAKSALFFLQQHKLLEKVACRFDVVSVGGMSKIEWIKNAFNV